MISIALGKWICKCSAASSITLYVTGFAKKTPSDLINSRQKWQQTTLIKYKEIIFPLNYTFKSHHST